MGNKDRIENEDFGDGQAWCNTYITETEIKFVLNKARLKKAVGIDNIPYEVLKNSISVPLLKCLFSKSFWSHVIPAVWHQAILKPIHSIIDPRLSIQYRGIALLSTVYMLYTNYVEYNCMMHEVWFNDKKSKIIHHTTPSVPHTTTTFCRGGNYWSVVKQNKYLRIIFDEFVDYNVTENVRADAGNRTLGAIIHKFR